MGTMLKSFKEYIAEAKESPLFNELAQLCKNIGYKKIKKISGSRFKVLIDGNRQEVLEKIEAAVQQIYPDAKWDLSVGSSSLGGISVNGFLIVVSPASRQGKASAGLDNEHTLFNMIGEITTNNGAADIIFRVGGKNEVLVKDVIGYKDAGRDTAGGKKADIVLHTKNGDVPISLKKANAEMWESADTRWWKEAKAIIDKLVKEKKIELFPHPKQKGIFQIKPTVAKKATATEKKSVVFGTDLLKKGFVLQASFSGKYTYENDKVVIPVKGIIRSPKDLKGDEEIYFLIRNDSSRKGSKIYPGLRVLAVKKSRINKNVLVV